MKLINPELTGKNIKLLREAAGLSQHDLSILTEISKRTIANIESGNLAGVGKLNTLTEFLNANLSDLQEEHFVAPTNFRKALQNFHKGNNPLAVTILNHPPSIVWAIKWHLIPSKYLETPREIGEIRSFFEKEKWSYLATSISTALSRMQDEVLVVKHPEKKGTFLYTSKG